MYRVLDQCGFVLIHGHKICTMEEIPGKARTTGYLLLPPPSLSSMKSPGGFPRVTSHGVASNFPHFRRSIPIFLPTIVILRLLLEERSPNRPSNALGHKILDCASRMKPIPPQTAHPIRVLASRIWGTVYGRVAQRKIERRLCIENRHFDIFVLSLEIVRAIHQKDVVCVDDGAEECGDGSGEDVIGGFLYRYSTCPLAFRLPSNVGRR